MLNRIETNENESLNFLYRIYINNDNYKKSIESFTKYKDYKELIDKTNMMKMNIKDISKLYDAFITLCMMYIEFDEKSPDCNQCSKYADEFVKKYNKLNNDSDIAKDSPYYRLLSTLSNDYDNFKKYCNSKGGKCEKYPSLTSIENMQNPAHSYGQISEDTSSSSSITTRLFTVLSIFGAIGFFLGISYKCKRFENVRKWISDELIDGNYQFKDDKFLNNDCNSNKFSNNYCNNNSNNLSSFCNNNISQSDLNKISAGCLYLLDEFIKGCGVNPPPARNNINIVDYILIWLGYMINLKYSEESNIMACFSSAYTHDCDKYNKKIDELTDYKDYENYKDIIDKKWYLLDMDSNIISNLYEAFKLLCEMYTEFDENKENCTNCSEKAEDFFKIYKELNDPNNAKYSDYCQVLSTLSNDYKNLKNKYNSLPEIDTTETDAKCSEKNSKQGSEQLYAQGSEHLYAQGSEHLYAQGSEHLYAQGSEDTSSSSSIASKLIPVLLIFAAIAIFFGISYKEIYNTFNIFILVFVIWISETISKTKIKRKAKKCKEENESLINYSEYDD
ncbi:hypothetical protein YYC_03314 [Plasmodium yoelii 17X]|uniref:Uncharacterized protein n=1 Tax=Plasmodium yoelii 17X TaxID=1323249 RepID=V7PJP5_PLAYE|nr:hypothetical protein YYC_03314 [Plasmodium yoelii 17X]